MPLESSLRHEMETRIGHDFSTVRVHAGADAAQSARQVNASAYTVGDHIVFGSRRFAPTTHEGRRLIAHELAHVAQQGRTETIQGDNGWMRQPSRSPRAQTRGLPLLRQIEDNSERAAPGALQQDDDTPATAGGGDPGLGNPSTVEVVSSPAVIVKIVAYAHDAGPAWAYLSDGSMKLVDVQANKLDPGSYKVSRFNPPSGQPKDATYIDYVNESFAWKQPVADSQPGEAVTVLIKATPEQRFAQLPGYIRAYVAGDIKGQPSLVELERLAAAGEELVKAGVTESDLAMLKDPDAAIEVEGKAPPDPDLVESLRLRGLSNFPSKENYLRHLAWQTGNSADFRRWWPDSRTAAAYWREFPEEAAKDWAEWAEPIYQNAKQKEKAEWIEAFRKIDAAAGVVTDIAWGTLIGVGGFLVPEIAALPVVDVPAAIEAASGVRFALWAKAAGLAMLSTAFINSLINRSKEGSADDTNPVSVVSAALLDTFEVANIIQAVTDKSVLTGKSLNRSRSERAESGILGVLDTGMNILGLREFTGGGTPHFEKPTLSLTEPPTEPAPAALTQSEQGAEVTRAAAVAAPEAQLAERPAIVTTSPTSPVTATPDPLTPDLPGTDVEAAPAPARATPPEPTTPPKATKAPRRGSALELPPGVRSSKLRRRGMELVNQLPKADRERISRALRKLPAEEAGRILSEIGRQDDVTTLEEALAARREAARAGGPPEGPAKPTGALDDSAPPHLDEDDEWQQFEKRPPPRVSETEEGVSRSALKGRMIKDGQEPKWADKNPANWNPHHLIPVSLENHPVLETLRANGGWDNNASRNGFALPTKPGIKGAKGLPVHQVTPEVIRQSGRPVPDPQTMRDLQGHPVWNQKVRDRLDALEPFMNRPDELRTKVEALIDDLRHDIETSVANGKSVLF